MDAIDGVRRIDHVALVVRNLETALRFYHDTLGIEASVIEDVPTEGVRIAFLPMGGSDGTRLELVQPVDPTNSIARFLEKHGEGQHHICLEVNDIDAALARLRAQGVRVLDDTPRVSVDGRAIFIHPREANGVLYELVQRENVHDNA
jgi:methylmalonyl-CoA epimerase